MASGTTPSSHRLPFIVSGYFWTSPKAETPIAFRDCCSGYLLGLNRIATAPEANSTRLTSFNSTHFDKPWWKQVPFMRRRVAVALRPFRSHGRSLGESERVAWRGRIQVRDGKGCSL